MTDDPELERHAAEGEGTWDDALCRLEDVLLDAPFDEVLPDLADLLERARVPLSFVEHDERARKLLGEAMLARPPADGDVVRRARVRMELLGVEVQVLAERLRDPATPPVEVHRALDRIDQIRAHVRRFRERG